MGSIESTRRLDFVADLNIRSRILDFLGANHREYAVVFTANTTQALKLVAECFEFKTSECTANEPTIASVEDLTNGKSTLLMLRDSHTSVIGMREYKRYEQLVVTDFGQLDCFISFQRPPTQTEKSSLFVLTAMSNFCGRKYDLSVIERFRQTFGDSWSVCLDAGAWIAAAPLDLSQFPADFVTLSFYKMFGYPTGLGALIIRRSRAHLLRKTYMGGGTVEFLSTTQFDHRFKTDLERRFEDGTLDFYSIVALRHGFDELERHGGMKQIETHCMSLARRLQRFLTTRTHFNGHPIAVVYGEGWKKANDEKLADHQGDIVNFNLMRDNGAVVGYVEVQKMSDLFDIELRTGCMCNQGACSSYLGLRDDERKKQQEMGKVCDDEMDMIDGQPLGSVRISFGRLNTDKEVELVEQMITVCFINPRIERPTPFVVDSNRKCGARLRRIFVYPIKSAGSISPAEWSLSRSGLRYDRRWMIVSADGVPLTQKKYPALCSLMPEIENDQLVVKDRFNENNVLRVRLQSKRENSSCSLTDFKHCIKNVNSIDCGDRASMWLQSFDLPAASRLVRTADSTDDGGLATSSFSNQAEYLLLTTASIRFLAEQTGLSPEVVERRFRANFVIETESGIPFEEDEFDKIYIGSVPFTVVGKCTRCQMICIDQETGEKDPNLLLSLRGLRSGKMTFGVYLSQSEGTSRNVVVGSFVLVERKTSNDEE